MRNYFAFPDIFHDGCSTQVNGLPVVEMIYGNKKFEAFFLRTWLTEGGMLKTILR